MVSTQIIDADWLSKSSRFQAFPPCPQIVEEEEVFRQYPCSARPKSPPGTRMCAVDWCWECCDICWRTMRVWAYMRWHNQHEMGHMWGLQDSPAVGATRYGHGLTRWRTRKKTGRRTRFWRYFKVLKLSN